MFSLLTAMIEVEVRQTKGKTTGISLTRLASPVRKDGPEEILRHLYSRSSFNGIHGGTFTK